jgi:hypothetical protein
VAGSAQDTVAQLRDEVNMSHVTKGLRTYFQSASTTEREIGQYVSEGKIDEVLSRLESSGYSGLGQVCYVWGGGSHPKSSYTDMDRQAEIRLVFVESPLPRGLRFIPSYRGLVKIIQPRALGAVFRKLSEQSTVVALIFDAGLEEAFVASARNIDKHGDHSFGIKADPGHMIYLVDEDREDSPTGMVHFLSHGGRGPWKELFNDIPESELIDRPFPRVKSGGLVTTK